MSDINITNRVTVLSNFWCRSVLRRDGPFAPKHVVVKILHVFIIRIPYL